MGGSDRGRLEAAIAAQESLRGVVPDDIVDAAVAGLRAQLGLRSTERRRRQATVLFADIGGFTSMSETMDAERLTILMNDLWSVLDDVVEEFGGRVDKHIGDALMAVWGAETSREDDPEQAVRAALRMQESLERFRIDRDSELAMRIGVNTGPVLLGAIDSTGEFTAMGDTVNVASRLEHLAPKNGILISHDTYRHVRGVFEIVARSPLAVRGKAEPIRVYEIRSEKPRAFRVRSRGIAGIETSMVGRDDEFDALRTSLEQSIAAPGAVVVEIVGEAGVGKSRLLWEFENWLELQPVPVYYFAGRAVSQRRSVPLSLIRDIVAGRFEIFDSDAPSVVVKKLVAGAERALEPHDAAVLAFWLGFGLHETAEMGALPTGERLAQIGQAHLGALLSSFAEDSPLVMVIEDLHWADDSSIEVFRWLLDAWRDRPLLVVAATRPHETNDASTLFGERSRGARMALEPLSGEQTRDLVRDMLRLADAIPVELVELVTERSEGNAFYVEELIKMLIDDGVIDVETEPWSIDLGNANLERVPQTLTGVLQARLDALPAITRRSLQHGSILGRTFWDDAARSLTDGDIDLEPAVERELLFEVKPSTFDYCTEYIFKHALLHDVVYETVLLEARPGLHAGAAAWLEDSAGPRRDELLIEIAGHWERAEDLTRAARLLESAARAAIRAGDPHRCLELVQRSMDLHGAADTEIGSSALTDAVKAHHNLGQLEAAADLVPSALAAAEATGDLDEHVNALLAAQRVALAVGDVDRSLDLLDRANALAEPLGGLPLGRVLTTRVSVEVRADRTPDPTVVARLNELVAGLSDSEFEASAHGALAAAFDLRGDHATALVHHEAALEASRRSGDRLAQVDHLSNIGVSFHLRAEQSDDASCYQLAAARYREAIDLCERFGFPDATQAITVLNLADIANDLGNLAEAKNLCRRVLLIAQEINSLPMQLAALASNARALIAAGDAEIGLAHLGLVSAHPARDAIADNLNRILQDVGNSADAQQMIAAGYNLDLTSVIAEVLEDFDEPYT